MREGEIRAPENDMTTDSNRLFFIHLSAVFNFFSFDRIFCLLKSSLINFQQRIHLWFECVCRGVYMESYTK